MSNLLAHPNELLAARLVKELVEEDCGVCQLRQEALVQLHCKARQVRRLPGLAAPRVRVRQLCRIA